MRSAVLLSLLSSGAILACAIPAAAQDTTQSPGKLNPTFPSSVTVPIASPAVDSGRAATRPLPTFDLPEYVVTGTSVIDLPEEEKQPATLTPPDGRPRATALSARDRSADAQPQELRESPPLLRPAGGMSGGIAAALGTYFSPLIRGWISNSDPSLSFHAGVAYHRTTGWVPHADRSGGALQTAAEIPVQSTVPLLDQGVVRADGAYTLDQYQFYGSIRPDVQREVSDLRLAFGFRNFTVPELPFDVALTLGNTVVQDSSTAVHEQSFGLSIRSVFDAGLLPVDLEFGVGSASLSDQLTARLSSFHLGATTRWAATPSLVLSGGVSVWSLQGMGGQNVLRVVPRIRAEYSGTPLGTVYAGFEPAVRVTSLGSQVDRSPYVSARNDLKHAYDSQKWLIGAETPLSGGLRTTVELSYRAIRDDGIPIDSGASGLWTMRFEDITILEGVAKAVAKFTANDYFACGLSMRVLHGSLSSSHVPYEPAVEADAWYEHRWSNRVTTSTDVRFCSPRDAEPGGAVQLPSLILVNARASYEWLKSVSTFVECRNLADQKIAWWRNYRDRPFSLFIGLTLNW